MNASLLVRVLPFLLLASPASGQAQEAYLKAFNSGPGDRYGSSVALAGTTIAVGAPDEDGSGVGVDPRSDNLVEDSGAVYVYRYAAGWTPDAYIKASNTGQDDAFGWSVAVDEDTLVVGALREDSQAVGVNGNELDNSLLDAGAAYVFVRDANGWSQQAYLKSSSPDDFDAFGQSVAISGDTIVIGARREDSGAIGVNGDDQDDSAQSAGAAYVYVRNGTSWTQQAYLKASNTGPGDAFGHSVAIDGDTILVGAYLEDGSKAVATGLDDDELGSSGATYVFVRNGTSWSQEALLKASNAGFGDEFGYSVDLDGETAIVGARYEQSAASGINGDELDDSTSFAGAAYIFARTGTNWAQQAYLKPHVAGFRDEFGSAVAVSGDHAVVGALEEDGPGTGFAGNPNVDSAFGSGAATLYERCGTDWSLGDYVKASNANPNDRFGTVVSASMGRFVIGALDEDGNANNVNGNQLSNTALDAGAVYAFVDPASPKPDFYCTTKTSSAGCISTITTTNPCASPSSGMGAYELIVAAQGFKNGLFFAGISGPAAIPFSGGTLCASPPLARGPIQNSGGSSPTSCDGLFAAVVNDGIVIPLGLDAGSGNSAWYQLWYRDPQNGAGTLGTALSNAVRLDFE